jgi:hypothetical protein
MRRIWTLQDQHLTSPEQGSDAWLEQRKGRITGSKPSNLFFQFKSPEDWDAILQLWSGDLREEFDETSKKRMAWGSNQEVTAIQAIVDHVPNSVVFDCPMMPINDVYAASPDGALIVFEDDQLTPKWHANIEIKCPGKFTSTGQENSPEDMKKMVQKKWKIPAFYYMIQIHMEMVAQHTSETLFVVWTPLLTRMWRIPFDRNYWNLCLETLESFRHKSVSYEVMRAKIDKLRRRSMMVSNHPIWRDIHTEI